MQIQFLGGASGVGASCLAIELANQWIVVDGGVRVGRQNDPLPHLELLQDKTVSAILVTHAHADHIGSLPLIHKMYPYAPIYASRATQLLMQIMLADAQRIMERRAVEELELPLYSPALLSSMLRQIRTFPSEPGVLAGLPGITVHTSRSGHVAGALSIGLVAEEGSLVISGDISITPQRTVQGAVPPAIKRPDLLLLESTYGAKYHPNRQAEETRLVQAVAAGIERQGHVLIPCFALGRGQELLLLLQAAQQQGHLPLCPIYVDGLIRKVCSTYSLVPEALAPSLAQKIRKGYRPFEGPQVSFIQNPQERQHIVQGPPCCILASSGMLTGGPSAWYAEQLLPNPNASIFFSGYLDEESPGRKLLDLVEGKRETVEIGGRAVPVACTVKTYSLSAHADQLQLASYAAQIQPRKIALVHGDEGARSALREALDTADVLLPIDGGTLNLSTTTKDTTAAGWKPPTPPPLPYGIGAGCAFTAADIDTLWKALSPFSNQVVTLRDLTVAWYGEQMQEDKLLGVGQILEEEQPYDEPYFVRHPELPEAYVIRKSEQDSREERLSRLLGQVVLLRTNPGSAKPALCHAREPNDMLRVIHPRGEYNQRVHYSITQFLDTIGHLPYQGVTSKRETLTEVVREARRVRKTLSSHRLARACQAAKRYTLSELCALLELSPSDLASRLAVAKLIYRHPRLFTVHAERPEDAGYARYELSPQAPSALLESEERERPDQSWLRSVVTDHLGTPADLMRISINTDTGDIVLFFFFPEIAQQRYGAAIDAAAAETGVTITLASQTHQGALAQAAEKSLPPGLHPQKTPSIFVDTKTVRIHCTGEATKDQVTRACEDFASETGWHLDVVFPLSPNDAETEQSPHRALSQQQVLEEARARLHDLPGFYKAGLDQEQHQLILRFDFPDIARTRYARELEQLENKTGWGISLHPMARLEALVACAKHVLPSGLTLVPPPSVHWDKRLLQARYSGKADQPAVEKAQHQFTEQSGWQLKLIQVR